MDRWFSGQPALPSGLVLRLGLHGKPRPEALGVVTQDVLQEQKEEDGAVRVLLHRPQPSVERAFSPTQDCEGERIQSSSLKAKFEGLWPAMICCRFPPQTSRQV